MNTRITTDEQKINIGIKTDEKNEYYNQNL